MQGESVGEVFRLEDEARADLADRLLQLAHDSGLEVSDETDLTRLLETLGAADPVPVRAVLALSEVLGVLFRHDGELARMRQEEGAAAGGSPASRDMQEANEG